MSSFISRCASLVGGSPSITTSGSPGIVGCPPYNGQQLWVVCQGTGLACLSQYPYASNCIYPAATDVWQMGFMADCDTMPPAAWIAVLGLCLGAVVIPLLVTLPFIVCKRAGWVNTAHTALLLASVIPHSATALLYATQSGLVAITSPAATMTLGILGSLAGIAIGIMQAVIHGPKATPKRGCLSPVALWYHGFTLTSLMTIVAFIGGLWTNTGQSTGAITVAATAWLFVWTLFAVLSVFFRAGDEAGPMQVSPAVITALLSFHVPIFTTLSPTWSVFVFFAGFVAWAIVLVKAARRAALQAAADTVAVAQVSSAPAADSATAATASSVVAAPAASPEAHAGLLMLGTEPHTLVIHALALTACVFMLASVCSVTSLPASGVATATIAPFMYFVAVLGRLVLLVHQARKRGACGNAEASCCVRAKAAPPPASLPPAVAVPNPAFAGAGLNFSQLDPVTAAMMMQILQQSAVAGGWGAGQPQMGAGQVPGSVGGAGQMPAQLPGGVLPGPVMPGMVQSWGEPAGPRST